MKKSGNTKKLSNTLGKGKLLISELLTRIELVTSTLPMLRTTDCAIAACDVSLLHRQAILYHRLNCFVNEKVEFSPNN